MDKERFKKISLNLPIDEAESLLYLARGFGTNITDTIRNELRRGRLLFDASTEGAEVSIKQQDSGKPQIVFADLEYIRRYQSKQPLPETNGVIGPDEDDLSTPILNPES